MESATNLDQQFDDNKLFCDDCQLEYFGNCTVHGPLTRIADKQVASGVPTTAKDSLPVGLVIQKSSIGNELGVYAKFGVNRRTVFGPYLGRTIDVQSVEVLARDHCWQIHGPWKLSHCIDGSDIAASNWMRFVNFAKNPQQQNLTAFQYKRHIFFRTIKFIPPAGELFVWFCDSYVKVLTRHTPTNNVKQPDHNFAVSRVQTDLQPDFNASTRNSSLENATVSEILKREPRKHKIGDPVDKATARLKDNETEGDHRCQTCGASFRLLNHLAKHLIAKHNLRLVYLCQGCPQIKVFRYFGILRNHQKRAKHEGYTRTVLRMPDAVQSDELPAHWQTPKVVAPNAKKSTYPQLAIEKSAPVEGSEPANSCAEVVSSLNQLSQPVLNVKSTEEIENVELISSESTCMCLHCNAYFNLDKNHCCLREEIPTALSQKAVSEKTKVSDDIGKEILGTSKECNVSQIIQLRARQTNQCDHCQMQFQSSCVLKMHIESKHPDAEVVKPQCSSASYPNNLAKKKNCRLSYESRERFVCNLCDKNFSRLDTLKAHDLRYHKSTVFINTNQNEMKRNIIDSELAKQEDDKLKLSVVAPKSPVGAHLENNVPKAPTLKLDPSITDDVKLNRNKRRKTVQKESHPLKTGNKPKYQANGSRPFVCKLCGQTSKCSGNLFEHQLNMHDVFGIYRCLDCLKCFDFHRHLVAHKLDTRHTQHERVTVGPNDYIFEYAQAQSCTSRQVSDNWTNHSNDRSQACRIDVTGLLPKADRLRPHVCNVCGVRFKYFSDLREHLQKKHDLRMKYTCRVCQQAFTTFREIQDHKTEFNHRNPSTKLNSSIRKKIQKTRPKKKSRKSRERDNAEPLALQGISDDKTDGVMVIGKINDDELQQLILMAAQFNSSQTFPDGTAAGHEKNVDHSNSNMQGGFYIKSDEEAKNTHSANQLLQPASAEVQLPSLCEQLPGDDTKDDKIIEQALELLSKPSPFFVTVAYPTTCLPHPGNVETRCVVNSESDDTVKEITIELSTPVNPEISVTRPGDEIVQAETSNVSVAASEVTASASEVTVSASEVTVASSEMAVAVDTLLQLNLVSDVLREKRVVAFNDEKSPQVWGEETSVGTNGAVQQQAIHTTNILEEAVKVILSPSKLPKKGKSSATRSRSKVGGYICIVCGKASNSMGNLKEHLLTVHDIFFIYKCTECKRCYDFRQQLAAHQVASHHQTSEQIGVGPNDFVEEYAASAGQLRLDYLAGKSGGHRINTDGLLPKEKRLRPFTCDLCQAPFRFFSCLRSHKTSFHKLKVVYSCEMCKLEFDAHALVRSHLNQLHHRGTVTKFV